MGEAILNIREAVQKEVERAVRLNMAIKDSGNRREFESGAVRDIDDSKGNTTLLPLDEVANLLDSDVIGYIKDFKESGDVEDLYASIRVFNKNHGWSDAESMLELSKHFAEGMKKYGKDNWKKGIPISSYMDSGIRHYLKVLAGWTDENHCRAFVWNMMCAIWTMNNKPELDDFTECGVLRPSEELMESTKRMAETFENIKRIYSSIKRS